MPKLTVGKFSANVWEGGHPVWIELSDGLAGIKIDHRDLDDLEHLVRRMKQMARSELPENYRHEVPSERQ